MMIRKVCVGLALSIMLAVPTSPAFAQDDPAAMKMSGLANGHFVATGNAWWPDAGNMQPRGRAVIARQANGWWWLSLAACRGAAERVSSLALRLGLGDTIGVYRSMLGYIDGRTFPMTGSVRIESVDAKSVSGVADLKVGHGAHAKTIRAVFRAAVGDTFLAAPGPGASCPAGWEGAVVSSAPLTIVPKSAPMAYTPAHPFGLENLKKAIANLPRERQTELLLAYGQRETTYNLHDAGCLALAYGELYRNTPVRTDPNAINNALTNVSVNDCINRPALVAYYTKSGQQLAGPQSSPALREAVAKCIAEQMADAYIESSLRVGHRIDPGMLIRQTQHFIKWRQAC